MIMYKICSSTINTVFQDIFYSFLSSFDLINKKNQSYSPFFHEFYERKYDANRQLKTTIKMTQSCNCYRLLIYNKNPLKGEVRLAIAYIQNLPCRLEHRNSYHPEARRRVISNSLR